MSNKKQTSSLCTLYSVYEEIPEEYLDKTDVDSCVYHNILDISQSHHRIVRVSKGSNKKSFAFKQFHFCDSKLQQRFILKEEVSISKRKTETLLDSSSEFLKAFDQANKKSQIPLPKPKFEIGFTKAKDGLFSHCYKSIVEHLNRQNPLSLRLEKNKTCVFSVKKSEHYVDQCIFTEVVNLGYREIKHLFRNRFFVAYKCDIFESNYDIWRQNKRKQIPTNHSHQNQKWLKWVQMCKKRVRFLLADALSNIFIIQIFLFKFFLQSIAQI